MNTDMVIRKPGKPDRKCYMLPWNAQSPRPWPNGYSRVVVPLNEAEMLTARPTVKAHILVVRNDKLFPV